MKNQEAHAYFGPPVKEYILLIYLFGRYFIRHEIKSIFALVLCALTLATVVYAVDVQVVSLGGGAGNAPIAENLSLTTYRSVSVRGTSRPWTPRASRSASASPPSLRRAASR
jgi:hypothetical protein